MSEAPATPAPEDPTALGYIAARLAEPSTWATLTAVLGVAGVTLPAGTSQAVAGAGMSIAALLGILLREKHHPKSTS